MPNADVRATRTPAPRRGGSSAVADDVASMRSIVSRSASGSAAAAAEVAPEVGGELAGARCLDLRQGPPRSQLERPPVRTRSARCVAPGVGVEAVAGRPDLDPHPAVTERRRRSPAAENHRPDVGSRRWSSVRRTVRGTADGTTAPCLFVRSPSRPLMGTVPSMPRSANETSRRILDAAESRFADRRNRRRDVRRHPRGRRPAQQQRHPVPLRRPDRSARGGHRAAGRADGRPPDALVAALPPTRPSTSWSR